MRGAYYNEIDPYAAQWLRNLIAAGHIAPGDVDERSIEDVKPDDLRQYKQCHFFAGIGVWSHSLRRAGWSDDRPVWTGSCPCQPFSDAGKGAGFDDERHLWPSFQWLIQELRPEHIFGEQVASKSADVWFDLVQADLEGMGYTFGLVPYPSAGVGAPHIRDRAYWVAHADMQHKSSARNQTRLANTGWPLTAGRVVIADGIRRERREMPTQRCEHDRDAAKRHQDKYGTECGSETGTNWLGNATSEQQGQEPGFLHGPQSELGRGCRAVRLADSNDDRQQPGARGSSCGECPTKGNDNRGGSEINRVANTSGYRWQGGLSGWQAPQWKTKHGPVRCGCPNCRPGPVNGFWRDSDWLYCRDGKWRPVRPGTFPLANGASSRVGRLRAYGNAINSDAATAFIESYMEVIS
ncbi:DNA cytosine methyltransferase [Serratia fonticola]|uniref:DNA cytosine methyltransferase n=1 Tax=Serratia fonticola TaxID=47917 RepID=UPI001AE9029F|nr:DNA cytosine methyltransferase [Serratia fonticola]MBP1034005.1 DNA cytosine methyltransferase [Serratia fonticola]